MYLFQNVSYLGHHAGDYYIIYNDPKTITPMNTTILTIVCLLMPLLCSAQEWRRVAVDNFGTSWLDESTVIVVGHVGTIMKSEDRGTTWRYVSSGTAENLRGVRFFDRSHGIAVGDRATLLRTSDGGENWTVVPVPVTSSLTDVAYMTGHQVSVVGSNGTLLRTEDGGETWSSVDLGTKNVLIDVAFGDSLHGIVVGAHGSVFRTIDGGSEWTPVPVDTTVDYFGVDMRGSDAVVVGYKVGPSRAGVILLSNDTGTTWHTADTSGLNIYFRTVTMLDSGRIVAAGNYPRATDTDGVKVATSDDGGMTWAEVREGFPIGYYDLADIQFTPEGMGVAVGEHGSIMFSQDAGRTWAARSYATQWEIFRLPLIQLRFSGAVFFDGLTGVVVGEDDPGGVVLRTTDAGLTWSTISVPGAINGVVAFDRDNVIGLADPGHSVFHLEGKMWNAEHEGLSWNLVEPKFNLVQPGGNPDLYEFTSSFHFLSDRVGYFSGDSLIFKTLDGGETWVGTEFPSYQSYITALRFFDQQHGWVATEQFPEVAHVLDSERVQRLYKTDDGGSSWQEIRNSYGNRRFDGIWLRNEREGWVTHGHDVVSRKSGTIYHTTDGGATWDSVSVDGSPLDVRFFTDSLGFAVGSNGLILKTTDAGTTWNREYPWQYRPEDSMVTYTGTYLLPDARTMMVYGIGALVRGEFPERVTGVSEHEQPFYSNRTINVIVVPNPSQSGECRVAVRGGHGAVTLGVYDVLGRQLLHVDHPEAEGEILLFDIQTEMIPRGTYQLVVQRGELSATSRLVIMQ